MKESDIRFQELTQRYVELSAKYSKHYFIGDERRDLPCVACGSTNIATPRKIDEDLVINFLKNNARVVNSNSFIQALLDGI